MESCKNYKKQAVSQFSPHVGFEWEARNSGTSFLLASLLSSASQAGGELRRGEERSIRSVECSNNPNMIDPVRSCGRGWWCAQSRVAVSVSQSAVASENAMVGTWLARDDK